MPKTVDAANFVPAMREDKPCPYCGGATTNVGFEYITCGAGWNEDCFGHQVRTPVLQVLPLSQE